MALLAERSAPRIPDSRLPGAEPTGLEAGAKEAELKQHSDSESASDNENFDFSSCVALWPLVFLIVSLVTVGFATAWYGPKTVIQTALQYLVPERPNFWNAVAIWLAIVLCTTLGIPILLFLLAVPAMMFGFFYGFLVTSSANIAAAAVSFVIGRYVTQRPVRKFLEGNNFKFVMRVLHSMEDDEAESMKLLILFRFMMMPMIVRNYGPAILRVPIWKLVVSAIPHSLWSGVVFATVGSALQGPAELLRDSHKIAWRTPQWQQIGGLLTALVSFVLFTYLITRAYHRRVEAELKRESRNDVYYGSGES